MRRRKSADHFEREDDWPSDARRSRERSPDELRSVSPAPSRFRGRLGRAAYAGVIVVGLTVTLMGDGGLRDLWSKQRELRSVGEQVEQATREVASLEAEIESLRAGGTARERIAREELGLVSPGELTILLPRGSSDSTAP